MNILQYLLLDKYHSTYKDLSHDKLSLLFKKIQSIQSIQSTKSNTTTRNSSSNISPYPHPHPYTQNHHNHPLLLDLLPKIRSIVITYYIHLSSKNDNLHKKIKDKQFICDYNSIVMQLFNTQIK